MFKIARLCVAAVLLWCVWWWGASHLLRAQVGAWFEARSTEGWQAEVGGIGGGGFPLALVAGLRDIAVADPQAGLAIKTEALDISARAVWPGFVSVVLDDGPVSIASPLGRSELIMQDGVVVLNLTPGTALELQDLGWTAGPWAVRQGDTIQASAQDLTLTMARIEGAQYALVASAQTFSPGDAARRLRLPNSVPQAFDSLQMRAEVTFDRPWDRLALSDVRPQPRVIDLHLLEAVWGDMQFNLSADLTVDARGVADGRVSLQAENWQTMLDVAEQAGLLPSQLRGQADAVLNALAGASGNETTLDVTLTLNDGVMTLGFFPLGPAPRLVLR